MRGLVALLVVVVAGTIALWQIEPDRGVPAPVTCGGKLAIDERFNADLARAIEVANQFVDGRLKMFLHNNHKEGDNFPYPVPVSSIRRSRAGNMVAQVPVDCAEILLFGGEFYNGMEAVFDGDSSQDDLIQMLVLLLLHELGHIENGHHGQFLPAGGNPVLNTTVSTGKQQETEADQFVINSLRPIISGEQVQDGWDAWNMMTFIARLSFLVFGNNTLDCFACRTLGSTEIYWDHSRSHENLELRLLRLSYGLNPTEGNKQMIHDFEQRRIGSVGNRVLYVDPDLVDGEVESQYNLGLDLNFDSELKFELDLPELQIDGETPTVE